MKQLTEDKTVSGYILECKLKRIIWHVPSETLEQLNEIRNRRNKNKPVFVDRDELIARIEKASIDTMQHLIAVFEQDGALEFLICMMDFKK
jgi:hypothetical protein